MCLLVSYKKKFKEKNNFFASIVIEEKSRIRIH
jgi:hypothetical protein